MATPVLKVVDDSLKGFFELRKIANRRKRWGALGPRDGTDAVLVVGDVRLPVHSTVLGTQTTFFRGKNGDIELNGWSIHIIWRTLELVYCQEQPCPKTNMPDTCDDLSRHAPIYQLAELWGLPYDLRRVAYQKYIAISQDMWRAEDFAASAEKVLSQPPTMQSRR